MVKQSKLTRGAGDSPLSKFSTDSNGLITRESPSRLSGRPGSHGEVCWGAELDWTLRGPEAGECTALWVRSNKAASK